jgi:hypothetical protein
MVIKRDGMGRGFSAHRTNNQKPEEKIALEES